MEEMEAAVTNIEGNAINSILTWVHSATVLVLITVLFLNSGVRPYILCQEEVQVLMRKSDSAKEVKGKEMGLVGLHCWRFHRVAAWRSENCLTLRIGSDGSIQEILFHFIHKPRIPPFWCVLYQIVKADPSEGSYNNGRKIHKFGFRPQRWFLEQPIKISFIFYMI